MSAEIDYGEINFVWANVDKFVSFLKPLAIVIDSLLRGFPDNTQLSQNRPLDVVLVRLQRPKDSPFFGVLVFGTSFGCGKVRLVIIQ